MKDKAGHRLLCGKCDSAALYVDYVPGLGEDLLACMKCGNRAGSVYGIVAQGKSEAAAVLQDQEIATRASEGRLTMTGRGDCGKKEAVAVDCGKEGAPAVRGVKEGEETMAKVGMCENCLRPEAKMADNGKICFSCSTYAKNTVGEEREKKLSEAKALYGSLKPGEQLTRGCRKGVGVKKDAAEKPAKGAALRAAARKLAENVSGPGVNVEVGEISEVEADEIRRKRAAWQSDYPILTIMFNEKTRAIYDRLVEAGEANIREPHQQALFILKNHFDSVFNNVGYFVPHGGELLAAFIKNEADNEGSAAGQAE